MKYIYIKLENDEVKGFVSQIEMPTMFRDDFALALFHSQISYMQSYSYWERHLKEVIIDENRNITFRDLLDDEDYLLFSKGIYINVSKIATLNPIVTSTKSGSWTDYEIKFDKTKNMETKTEKYVVIVEGKSIPTKVHENYETAEREAKRLCEKERRNAHVLKIVSLIELPPVEFKITKF